MENKTLFGRYSSMRDVKALLQKLKIITLNSLTLLKRVIIMRFKCTILLFSVVFFNPWYLSKVHCLIRLI